MELRSLRFTIYAGALALIACGSSAPNSSPFESATNSKDASTGNTSSSGGSGGSGSSGGSSSGGTDNQNMNASCKQDSDCSGGCNGATVCCCDPNALTCFSPASGQCGGDSGAGGGDDGSSGDDGGNMMPMP